MEIATMWSSTTKPFTKAIATLGLAAMVAAFVIGAITTSPALAQSAPYGAQKAQQHGCGTSFGSSCADSN
jgi:hypothetical protein